MSPDAFAALFPRLYHVAWPQARARIRRDGLMSPVALVEREGLPESVLETRRKAVTELRDGVILNDNTPIFEASLRTCLPADITVADWLRELNSRVFLFPDREAANAFAGVKAVRHLPRDIWVFDTLRFTRAFLPRMEITPFNTGSAKRGPPFRDRSIYAPLKGLDYREWRARRRMAGVKAGLDSVREVCVRHAAPGAADHAVEIIKRPPA